MKATAGKWITIYVAVLAAILLIAKYPFLLEGRLPLFAKGEIWRTLVFAALGTGLIEIITYRVKQLKSGSSKRRRIG